MAVSLPSPLGGHGVVSSSTTVPGHKSLLSGVHVGSLLHSLLGAFHGLVGLVEPVALGAVGLAVLVAVRFVRRLRRPVGGR